MRKPTFLWIFAFFLFGSAATAIVQTTHSANPAITPFSYNFSGGETFTGTLVTAISTSDNWATKDTEPKAQVTLNTTAGRIQTTAGGGAGGGENAVRLTTWNVTPDICIDFQHELVTDVDGTNVFFMFDDDLDFFNGGNLALGYGSLGGGCTNVWAISDDSFSSSKTCSAVAPSGTQNLTFCPNGTAYINNGETTISHPSGWSGTRGNFTVYWQSGGSSSGNEEIMVRRIFGWKKQDGAPQAPSLPIPPIITVINLTSEGGTGQLINLSDPTCQNAGCIVPRTIDTTPTFWVTTNASAYCRIGITDSNYTDLGANRNCTSSGLSHTCTIITDDELHEENSLLYIGCQSLEGLENRTSTNGAFRVYIGPGDYETLGRIALESAAATTLTGYTLYANQKLYARSANDSQFTGTFDRVVKYLNKIWAFNVLVGNDTAVGGFNITPALYVLEFRNSTISQINNTVQQLINATK